MQERRAMDGQHKCLQYLPSRNSGIEVMLGDVCYSRMTEDSPGMCALKSRKSHKERLSNRHDFFQNTRGKRHG